MVPVGKPIDLTREGAPSHSLISNSSLDEFEDIHAKAKSILNKGNFSFGHKFYVEEEGKEIYQKSTSNDNDTFDLEDDSNQEYQVPKFNPPAHLHLLDLALLLDFGIFHYLLPCLRY